MIFLILSEISIITNVKQILELWNTNVNKFKILKFIIVNSDYVFGLQEFMILNLQ